MSDKFMDITATILSLGLKPQGNAQTNVVERIKRFLDSPENKDITFTTPQLAENLNISKNFASNACKWEGIEPYRIKETKPATWSNPENIKKIRKKMGV
jgi:hypothetical protein